MNEFEILAQSEKNGGKWGFLVPADQIAGVSLLTVDLPTYMARTWTLNLLTPQSTGVNLNGGVPAGVTGQPQANATLYPEMYARIDYGVGGVLQTVEIDYPSRGCTVQFHAATIRVYVNIPSQLTTNGIKPIVGGFLTPYPRGNVATDSLPSCCYTSPRFNFTAPAAPPVTVWAPPRARGYRLVPEDTLAAEKPVTLEQISFNNAATTIDCLSEPFDTGSGALQSMQILRNNFIPLMREAQGVRVTAGVTGVESVFYRIQWLLDIG